MSTTTPVYIKGHEKVVAALGQWSVFHKAPARLIRVDADRIDLELKPYRAQKSAKDDSARRIAPQHRILFSFTGLLAVDVYAFEADNIIDELNFSTPDYVGKNGSFIVDLESAMGCGMGGHLRAKNGEVIAIE